MLQMFFDLRGEINVFMKDKRQEVKELSDNTWLGELALACDITAQLNELNIRLQGKGKIVSDVFTAVKSFESKLSLLHTQAQIRCLDNLPCCRQLPLEHFQRDLAVSTLSTLRSHFSGRFSDFRKINADMKLFQNPFSIQAEDAPPHVQMELIDLQSDDNFSSLHSTLDIASFYSRLASTNQFPNITAHASKMLAIFASTYICEQTFSRMTYIKSRLRSRLSNDHLHALLRCGVTSFEAEIEKLSTTLQSQPSH